MIQVRPRPVVDESGRWGSTIVLALDGRPLPEAWVCSMYNSRTFDSRLSMLSLPNYTTISVSGAPSLLSDNFDDFHLVLFGDLGKNKGQLSADKTKNTEKIQRLKFSESQLKSQVQSEND